MFFFFVFQKLIRENKLKSEERAQLQREEVRKFSEVNLRNTELRILERDYHRLTHDCRTGEN